MPAPPPRLLPGVPGAARGLLSRTSGAPAAGGAAWPQPLGRDGKSRVRSSAAANSSPMTGTLRSRRRIPMWRTPQPLRWDLPNCRSSGTCPGHILRHRRVLGPAAMVEHYLIVSCGLSLGVDVVNALHEKDTSGGYPLERTFHCKTRVWP